jgi:ABC-2 type transport system permease protein
MIRYLRLAILYIKLSFKSIASYRGAFILNALSQIAAYTVDFALMWIMINTFGSMNGWTKYEVILLYAMSLASYALAGFFFYNIRELSKEIRTGQFDDKLVKPLRLLPYLICTNFNRGYVAHLALAIILIALCFGHLGVALTAAKLAFFVVAVVAGALIYSALFLITMVPSFFFIQGNALGGFIFMFREMSYYPLSIFPRILQIFLSFVLPYGMMNFFPVQAVLGKTDFLFFDSCIMYVAPLFAVALFSASVWFFYYGAKRYKSSGT